VRKPTGKALDYTAGIMGKEDPEPKNMFGNDNMRPKAPNPKYLKKVKGDKP